MTEFSLDNFLPYLLNNAAETTSRAFSDHYRKTYGLSRAQWRIMAHLGSLGGLTASDICTRGFLEKSKVSRAVVGLEEAGMLHRVTSEADRRAEVLSLTGKGQRTYDDLSAHALAFQSTLVGRLGQERADVLTAMMHELIDMWDD